MATKSCDGETIPLCHYHHQALHLYGDEIEFFEMSGFEYGEILEMCRVLCEESPSKRIKDAAILQNFERYIAS